MKKFYLKPISLILSLFLSLQLLAENNTNENISLEKVNEAFQKSNKTKALVLAQKFLSQQKESSSLDEVTFIAGRSASLLLEFEIAIKHYKDLLKKFPESKYVMDTRADLVNCYTGLRKLEVCISQCKDNLAYAPKSVYADHWTFTLAHSQFKLYNFKNAKVGLESFLKNYPKSSYRSIAQKYLNLIDPDWTVGDHGLIQYSGKFKNDIRLKARIDEIPALLEKAYKMIHERLGVDFKEQTDMIFMFEDAGKKRSSLIAQQFVAGIDNKPVSIIKFMTEKILVRPQTYRITLIHEVKHSAFKQLMGQAYSDLPEWVREGLAVWAADQMEIKLQHILLNKVIARKSPLLALDGIEDKKHDYVDYLEDYLAFEWLESVKPGNIKTFCQRLIQGENYKAIWADLANMNYQDAMEAADSYCKKKVESVLGESYQSFLKIINENYKYMAKGNNSVKQWGLSEGIAKYEKWLEKYPACFIVPYARFSLARLQITSAKYEQGRQMLRKVLEEDSHRCALLDDAQFWIGMSYNLQKNRTKTLEAFGILLRDYPNSTYKVKGARPAPPLTN